MSHALRIVAIDDLQEDLDVLTYALPHVVDQYLCDLAVATPEEVLSGAIARLRESAPDVLVLDMRWDASYNFCDGERLLRVAFSQRLLTGIHVIIWTKYMDDVAKRIKRMTTALSASGVRSVNLFHKSELTDLVLLMSKLS